MVLFASAGGSSGGEISRPGWEAPSRGLISVLLVPRDRLDGEVVVHCRRLLAEAFAHDPDNRGRRAPSHEMDVAGPLLELSGGLRIDGDHDLGDKRLVVVTKLSESRIVTDALAVG